MPRRNIINIAGMIAFSGPGPAAPPPGQRAVFTGTLAATVAMTQTLNTELAGPAGMAAAVVYQGEVLYAKGFGVQKVGDPGAVDAHTVFQLASDSKPLGATVVAHQVTAGTVTWATPLVQNLPDFQLSEPYVTSHVTIGHMYAHRSGLPEHAGDLLEDLGYDRAEILTRLRALDLHAFGTYDYTSFGMTAGAESVAAAAGTDWATLSQKVLYGPLGMTSTSSRFSDYIARPDRAWTHSRVDGTWEARVVRDPDAQSPAGGVSSSVDDAAKWMIMLLNGGTGANGAVIASPEALTPAMTPQIVSKPVLNGDPSTRAGYYGFGFDVNTQSSSRQQVSHSGAFNAGAATNFLLDPGAKLGVVALANGSPIGAVEAVAQEFMDRAVYGSPQFD